MAGGGPTRVAMLSRVYVNNVVVAETLNTRVTRLERAMTEVTENLATIAKQHSELDGLVKTLLDAQIKTEERFRQTDARIEKLVSAIGESINHVPQIPPRAS